jgi:ribosome-binding protein aMBF1 (putative translation factor)
MSRSMHVTIAREHTWCQRVAIPHNGGMMEKRFGIAVQRARAHLRVRQQDLADVIGMDRGYLSKIERSRVQVPERETQAAPDDTRRLSG